MQKPPLPPFNEQTAKQKVRMAEDAWNTKDPQQVAQAYTKDSVWRNRNAFLQGRDDIVRFLMDKWQQERDYCLIKELWAYTDHRIAVRFAYEYRDDQGQWYRAYGNENWEFDEHGLMVLRYASINDVAISETQRKLVWEGDRRPDNYASLTALGL